MNLKQINLSKTVLVGRGKKATATHPDIKTGFKNEYLIFNKQTKRVFVGGFLGDKDLNITNNIGGFSMTWYLSLNLKNWEVFEIIS